MPLLIRKVQIKPTMSYNHTSVKMAKIKKMDMLNVDKNVEPLELSYTAGVNVKWK